jgi:hypothetical protein
MILDISCSIWLKPVKGHKTLVLLQPVIICTPRSCCRYNVSKNILTSSKVVQSVAFRVHGFQLENMYHRNISLDFYIKFPLSFLRFFCGAKLRYTVKLCQIRYGKQIMSDEYIDMCWKTQQRSAALETCEETKGMSVLSLCQPTWLYSARINQSLRIFYDVSFTFMAALPLGVGWGS